MLKIINNKFLLLAFLIFKIKKTREWTKIFGTKLIFTRELIIFFLMSSNMGSTTFAVTITKSILYLIKNGERSYTNKMRPNVATFSDFS